MFPNLAADLRFTFRMFRKAPGTTAVAILSLALGIGASSAIFSLVYALWFDPYPYRDSDRLLNLTFLNTAGQKDTLYVSLADYLEMHREVKTLETLAARDDRAFVITSGLPESLRGVLFSPEAFDHFGVPALLGRTFGPQDLPQPAAPPRIAVLSYLFWQRHYFGNTNAIGQTLELDRLPYTVVGVMPPRFTWNDADVYVPLPKTPDPKTFVALMLRVKKGVGLSAVDAELQAMVQRFGKRNPSGYPKQGFRIQVETLNDFLLARFGPTLKILLAAVAMLLMIGCANVSILLLARATARQKEIAVRVSLGAGRWRIIQQLLTESVLLSLCGGLLGVLLAYRGVAALVALMPEYSVPHEAVIHVNGAVVLFTFAVSVLTGILFGMAPALQLSKTDVNESMQDGGKGTTANSQGGATRSVLIVAEIALTIVLLVGAAVAIRSFFALSRTPLGYRPDHVLSFNVTLPQGQYPDWAQREAFFENVLDRVRSVPGVESATMTETATPPRIAFRADFDIAGLQKRTRQEAYIGLVGDGYFDTVGIPLARGRLISDSEIRRTAQVALINEEMARRYWTGGRDPIGGRVSVPALDFKNAAILIPERADRSFEIIGVVKTALNRGLREPAEPAIYVPQGMALISGITYLVKTSGDAHQYARALRQAVQTLPVSEVFTLDEILDRREQSYPRFSTTLFTLFASAGLLLAATGLYSVVSYTVARRTHEFGIRMALGAQRWDVLRHVLGATIALVALGSAAGLAASLTLSGIVSRYVEGWNARDPLAFFAVVLVLLFVAVAACWLPVRRATAIQPMRALRHD